MEPFESHTGLVAAMDRSNVDTDQIIPKQFLKRIERTGFGQFVFFDWRFLDNGSPNPDFELNAPAVAGASILLVRQNFGCGSSREHAVWALADYGFRCVLAESFGDIFFNNCMKNGVLPIALDKANMDQLFELSKGDGFSMTVDLRQQTVASGDWQTTFDIDPVRKEPLLRGLDDIAMTLEFETRITDFEQRRGMTPLAN